MDALGKQALNESATDETLSLGHDDDSGPVRVQDHYALNLFAGIHCLLAHIDRLSAVGGESVEQHFSRYPYLREYHRQILLVMPGTLDWAEGRQWWRANLRDIAEQGRNHLPLKALGQQLRFGHETIMALMLAGLVEEDSRFGTLFADLQQPLGYRRPMLETLGHVVAGVDALPQLSPWDVCSPLLATGLVQADNTRLPRSEWVLKVDPELWDLIRTGQPGVNGKRLKFIAHGQLTPLDDVIVDHAFQRRLKGIPSLFRQGRVRTLVLRAPEGSHSVEVAGAVAQALGRNVVVQGAGPEKPEAEETLGIACTLLNAMPVYPLDLDPGETAPLPGLAGYGGPAIVILGNEGGLDTTEAGQLITLTLPGPDYPQRIRLWERYLNGSRIEKLEAVARRFRLPGAFIEQVAGMAINNVALEGRPLLTPDDIRRAARNLNHQKLDTLADPLEARGSWSQLISAAATSEKLHELEQRCHYRERLQDHLGPAFGNSSNCGVRALFTGRSGTGKTLAARILAAELGMDIYRVDLASIVNKYIGETEKNLNKVLTRAEALDVVLLLDEGDSLLGGRTEVKNANDRYANLETNYLLQRLENYQGIILVTTNLSDNIDKAFQRRMDIVIPFFQPQMDQRLAIFHLHLPPDHRVDDLFLEKVSRHCALMGGQIRNVCLHASLVALDEGVSVSDEQLDFALRSEYRKNGGTYPLTRHHSAAFNDGGMGAFTNALSQHY